LKNILKEEAGGKFLVLEDVKETINRAHEITPESIAKESKTIAANKASGVIGALKVLPRAVKNVNILELILALSTILIIYGFKKITTAIPSTLVALLVMTAISVFFNLNYRPIEAIPSGLPSFQMGIVANFNLAQATFYIFSAFTLALLGAIDSLLTSVVADNMTKSKHNPNQELVGQGIGNIVAAFFGGIPGAGATIRTVVNIKAGGKTRISGMIAACVLLIVLLVLGPLASKIPAAVLAGILLTVGIGVMDYKGLKAIPHMPKTEVVVMLTVLILSAFWDLIFAVGIGLVIASLMFMKKIGSVIAQRSSVKALDQELIDESGQHSLSVLNNKVFIKQIRGPLFFGYTSDFQEMASQIPSTATTVVIRMENMPYMDQSGLYAMEDVLVDLIENNKKILLVGIIEQPKYMLEQIKIIPDLIPAHQIFGTYPEAIKWLEANI
jgi:sulfate permease, SulP family